MSVCEDSLAASERTSRTPQSVSTDSVSSSTSGWSASALSPGYSHATRSALCSHLLKRLGLFLYGGERHGDGICQHNIPKKAILKYFSLRQCNRKLQIVRTS